MTAPLVFAALAGVVAILAWTLRGHGASQPLSGRTGAAIIGCVTLVGISYLAVLYFAPWWLKWPAPPPPSLRMLPEGDYPKGVLAAGSQTPPLDAQGWINGPPDFKRAKVTVIDIWAAWCPFCRATAPGLVELHDKFAGRGVDFVSVTTMPEASARDFVTAHKVPWSAGFSVPPATVARFGAYNHAAMIPGYEVAPTLYLVDGDGKVLWCDDQGRYTHEEPEKLLKRLEAALEEQLARQ